MGLAAATGFKPEFAGGWFGGGVCPADLVVARTTEIGTARGRRRTGRAGFSSSGPQAVGVSFPRQRLSRQPQLRQPDVDALRLGARVRLEPVHCGVQHGDCHVGRRAHRRFSGGLAGGSMAGA